jgi:WD40 repeat protein
MALRADGTLVLAAQGGERVLWNPPSIPVRSTSRCAAQDEDLVLSADGGSLACIGKGGNVEVWSGAGASGRPLATIQAFPEAEHFDLSPDGRILAVASGGTASVWDISSGRSLRSLETETIQSLKLTSRTLATGHLDGTIRLWDIDSTSMKELQQSPPIETAVSAMAISPNAERLAALYVDGSVRIWEIETAKPSPILLPPGWVLAVAFSADGQRLATANDERTVTLWDAKTGIDLFRLHTYLQPVTGFAFHPDGRSLAVALKDGTVSIEPLNIQGLKRLAQGRYRPMSDPEKKKYRLE